MVKVVYEVGVGSLNSCRTKHFWGQGIECHLFEPNPEYYKDLVKAAENHSNVNIYDIALSAFKGSSSLYLANDCSFIDGIDSPVTIQNSTKDKYKDWDKIEVKTDIISNYDKGNIDLLLLDTEGAEWFVLNDLKSRPINIVVETHIPINNPPYLNRYIDKILFWMWQNEYSLIGKDKTNSYWQKIE